MGETIAVAAMHAQKIAIHHEDLVRREYTSGEGPFVAGSSSLFLEVN
jgi:hypothetical protein